MMNANEIFAQEINEFASLPDDAFGKVTVKSKYLALVKKYHPDTNDKIDKDILHEYMTAINTTYEKKQNGALAVAQTATTQRDARKETEDDSSRQFNYVTFAKLLMRYAGTVPYRVWKKKIEEEFEEITRLLVLEIKKSDEAVGDALGFLSTLEIINTTQSGQCRGALGYYARKFLYANRPTSIFTLDRIFDNSLTEYKNSCKKHARFEEIAAAVDAVSKWLKAASREER